ncbi:MAG: CYTH domain-containing protein, partial [Sulfurovum sp.]|nr:CYTH domain-containing protein [Sulfurovum sp.]
MAQEIERKFLVDTAKLPPLPQPLIIKQGYIPTQNATVRIRRTDDQAYLTIKGRATGLTRSEFEYPIPLLMPKQCSQSFVKNPTSRKSAISSNIRGIPGNWTSSRGRT